MSLLLILIFVLISSYGSRTLSWTHTPKLYVQESKLVFVCC